MGPVSIIWKYYMSNVVDSENLEKKGKMIIL